MKPPFSVIFLTTLIGVGQGLFLAMFTGQTYSILQQLPTQEGHFYFVGSLLSLAFLVLGLFASFFHLGHPERAWRAAAQWRTSWLSREVIALPVFMFIVFIYGVLHYFEFNPETFGTAAIPEGRLTIFVGMIGVVACFALFTCTAMIYACLKFLQEWNSPLTLVNYTLLGISSGFTLATMFADIVNSPLLSFFGLWAIIFTLTALLTRAASLIRNARIKHKSNLQTAIGVRHTKIQQKAQGSMGGSFNTREFFHGKTVAFIKSVKWIFLFLVFPVPVVLIIIGLSTKLMLVIIAAFLVQYTGLLFERWFFFAQANHPQNVYYQTI